MMSVRPDVMSSTNNDRFVRRALHRRIALAFDFDETLAPNTTDNLFEHIGMDAAEVRSQQIEPLENDGWESRMADAHVLLSISDGPHGPITQSTFAEVGSKLELYPGVIDMFDAVTDAAREVVDDIEVEFHLITAGFVHVPRATSIADRFTSIIGGHWAFDDDGRIVAPMDTVGHYDKVRHLMAIAKGLDSVAADQAGDVDSFRPEHEWHVPYEQMIFVGDGDSDLVGFDFMQSNGGNAIAVRQAESDQEWESLDHMREGRQVAALLKSDYSPDSPLLTTLCLWARMAATRVRMLEAGR